MRIDSIVRGSSFAVGLAAAIALAACAKAPQAAGTGPYSNAAAGAAQNACGEGGAPSGPVGPSAMPPQANASSAGSYSGAAAQAASNACGEGGAPSGAVGPSAMPPQPGASTQPGCYSGTEFQAAKAAACQ